MSTATVIVILLLGVIIYMQARKRGDTKQGRTLRNVALVFMVAALAIAILNAFDIVQDRDANDPAPRGMDVPATGNA
ncbi:MAG: hypothetical protein WBA68_00430 [Alteraurantiacibacter sp.]